jgi:predicted nucleotidyltransferase
MSQSELIADQQFIKMEEVEEKAFEIFQKYQPEKIILFGSYAEGNPTPNSDVDLLIIMDTDQPTWDVSVDISIFLKHTFPIDIIVKTPKEIVNRINNGDFFIKDIIENGKVLYERTDQ